MRAWRAAPVALTGTAPQPRSIRTIAEGLPDLADQTQNVLFYGAFFPQFVASDRPLGPQLALLSVTFVVIAGGLDGAWALAAGRARRVLSLRGRLRNRLTGAC